MTIKTKLVALGALGAAAYGVARAIRHRQETAAIDERFDLSDLDDAIVVTEEVIVITDSPPFDAVRDS
jgi:hypothetical protein